MSSAVMNEMSYSTTKPTAYIQGLSSAQLPLEPRVCSRRIRLAELINEAFDEMLSQEEQTMVVLKTLGSYNFEKGLLRRAEQCLESSKYQSSVLELIEILRNNWREISENDNVLFLCLNDLEISDLDRTYYLCSPCSRLSITISLLVKIMDKKGESAFYARNFSMCQELLLWAPALTQLDKQIAALGKVLARSKQLRKFLNKAKVHKVKHQ